MQKILTVKLIVFIAVFVLSPVTSYTIFAQENDPFETEAEDWSDEFLDEEPLDEEPPPAQAPAASSKKSETKPKKEAPPPVKKTTPPPPPKVKKPVTPPKPIVSKPKVELTIQQSESKYEISSSVKRAGAPLLMISRPVYAPYSNEKKTKYISAASEAYFHFKIGAISGLQVIPIERMSNNIQYFRDFSRRISRTTYIDAAKKLGAAYLFYQEYEPKGKSIKYSIELYSIADNKKLTGRTVEIPLKEFEDNLYDFVMDVAENTIGEIPKPTLEFLAESVIGNNLKNFEPLGDAIVSEGDYSRKRAEAAAPKMERLAKGKRQYLAKFVAAQTLARAGKYDQAIALQQDLKAAFAKNYRGLSLQLARFYRMQQSFNDALSEADEAALDPLLKLPVKIEKARIYEAQGNLNQAKREYESALSEGGEDGEIYFQLALVSIGLNNLSQAENYLKKTANAGRALDRGDYYNLGLRYEALGSANSQAIEAYKNSLGVQQDNEDAWQKLSEIYSATGQTAEAAQCYISLFHLNNEVYKEYLVKAGKMFEEGGYLENAREAYSLYIARRYDDPEVFVRLAKIEMQTGNCPKAIELVDGMDTTGEFGEDIIAINTQCGKEIRRVVVPTGTGDKTWRLKFIWSVSSGAVFIGGSVAGYFFDTKAKEKYDEYENYKPGSPSFDPNKPTDQKQQEILDLRNEVKSLEQNRNISYLVAGIGGISLAASIVIPIVLP